MRFTSASCVAALLLGFSTPCYAGIITFEDLLVPVGGQLNPPSGVGVVSGGFNYTPGPNNAGGFNDLHISNQEPFQAINGTTIGSTHDDVVLTQVGGAPFSLQSFDFAGFPTNNEVSFTVTGVRADASVIVANFTPDGLVDGPGGAVDFQTFNLGAGWTNLADVTWTHSGAGTLQGLFALDNIVVNQPLVVPEPMSLAIFGGLAVAGIAGYRRRQAKA